MIVCVAASAARNTCWKECVNTVGQYVSCIVQVHMRYSSAQVNMQQFLEGIAGPGKAELVARATEVLKTNDIGVHVSRRCVSHSCANALRRCQAPSHLRGLVLDDLSAVALSEDVGVIIEQAVKRVERHRRSRPAEDH